MTRILVDGGKTGGKKECRPEQKPAGHERKWERLAVGFNQICLVSVLAIPINRMLGIRLPLWGQILWVVVVFGSMVPIMIIRNRG